MFLYDIITDDLASNIVASLLYLDQCSNDKISIYINSEGGDIRSAFMIYDMINIIKSPIETICVGAALGEAALILAAGARGMRNATKNSIIKINQLIHTYSKYSDLANAKILLDQSKKDNIKYIDALSKCTQKTYNRIYTDTERDLYLSPQNAKKYNIIDNIVRNAKS